MEKNINLKITENAVESRCDQELTAGDALLIISHCYYMLIEAGMDIQDIADHSETILNVILEEQLNKKAGKQS